MTVARGGGCPVLRQSLGGESVLRYVLPYYYTRLPRRIFTHPKRRQGLFGALRRIVTVACQTPSNRRRSGARQWPRLCHTSARSPGRAVGDGRSTGPLRHASQCWQSRDKCAIVPRSIGRGLRVVAPRFRSLSGRPFARIDRLRTSFGVLCSAYCKTGPRSGHPNDRIVRQHPCPPVGEGAGQVG